MKIEEFRIGFRLLLKEAHHSALVLFGLAMGFAVCILLASMVHHAFSYDKQVPDSEHVYVVKSHFNFAGTNNPWSDTTPLVVSAAIAQSGMAAQSVRLIKQEVSLRAENTVVALPLTLVDPGFGDLFGVKVVEGDLAQALSRPDALALTSSTATALFADGRAYGKTVLIAGTSFQVQAVVADPPQATTVPYRILAGLNSAAWSHEARQAMLREWTMVEGKIYVRLMPGLAPAGLARWLEARANDSPLRAEYPPESLAQLGNGNLLDFRLGPLSDAYFDPDTATLAEQGVHGNRSVVVGLGAVAVMILFLAATNYVSLATVRTMRRQREIGVRKVLGAGGGEIMRRFLIESVCFSLLAAVLGALFAWLALPVFRDLINRQLDNVFTPVTLLVGVMVALVVGLLAGAYPAWLAMRVPARQLTGRGYGESLGGSWLRRSLTVMQFATAICLTGLTLAIAWQTYHASHLDPGFDPAPLLVLPLHGNLTLPENRSFAQALKRLPGVSGVAATTGVVGNNKAIHLADIQREGQPASVIRLTGVSPNFFDVYGVHPVAGRVFDAKTDPEDKAKMLVISTAAVRHLGYATPQEAIGQFVLFGRLKTASQIIGVVPDLRHQSARKEREPMVYLPLLKASVLTVRVEGSVAAIQAQIDKQWRRDFPDVVLEMDRLQDRIAANYADDLRLNWLLLAASIVIGIIASLGIYVLSAYSLQQRVKEIALRKLYGARRLDVVRLVGREVVLMVLLSAVIGLPLAALGTAKYLADFVERAPVELPSLLLAFVLSALMALAATARNTMAALRVAPALALRE